jgi:hypothetical protein
MVCFFGSPTLATMAQAVEAAPAAGNSQMHELLASIESMSEEDAQKLLKS